VTAEFIQALLVIATVGAGLMAGLFFVFSNTVMPAFDRLPAANAIMAMQRINELILNPLFFIVFFGTGVVCIAFILFAAARQDRSSALFMIAGAVIYLVGSIGVTIARNVPLNSQLARMAGYEQDLGGQWKNYRGPWTRWNHVRTAACAIAAGLFALA